MDVAREGYTHNIMINCTRDLLLSFLLTCHPYIPFHFMKCVLLYIIIIVGEAESDSIAGGCIIIFVL